MSKKKAESSFRAQSEWDVPAKKSEWDATGGGGASVKKSMAGTLKAGSNIDVQAKKVRESQREAPCEACVGSGGRGEGVGVWT